VGRSPAAMLLTQIADFGSSIMAGSDKIFSMRNCPGFSTPAFRSPESLTSGYQPSFEMDMWALGVCIYIWMYGCLPFTGGAAFIIYEKIRAQDVSVPSAPDVSAQDCGQGVQGGGHGWLTVLGVGVRDWPQHSLGC